jgi:competence protein ComEC
VASTIAAEGQNASATPRAGGAWAAAARAALQGERSQALLFAPVALGLGIGLWFLLPFNGQRQAALLAALALALAALALRADARRLAVAAGLLVALGLLAADFRSARVAEPALHHRLTAAPLTGTVLSVSPHEGGVRHSLLLRRDATDVDPAVTVRIALRPPLPPGLAPGARVRVPATLGPVPGPALPGAHDPARRAWFLGISAAGRAVAPPTVLAPAPVADAPLARARQALGARISAGLGGDAGAIAAALTVGEQGLIRADLLEAMRVAGLAHILTVSGFHIGVAVTGMLFLLRHTLALWPALALRTSVPRLAAIGAGLAGTGYALLSGAELPAVRAAIAAWIVLAGLMLGRDPLSPRLIAFAAFVILLARPEALTDPSFQLSFAAVTALVALARSPLGAALAPRPEEGLLPRAARLLALMVATGLVAELVLTPIALAHFGRSGAYGVVANLAAIPLTSFVIMPLLAAWLLLAPLGAGAPVALLLRPALEALAGIGEAVAAWPGATLSLPALPPAAAAALLAGGLLVALLATRLRLAGLPLIALGAALALLAPRPDLFVGADGRQVAVVHEGRLHTLRGHRDGFVVSNWAEQAAAPADARLADLPGARCMPAGCAVQLASGLRLLALTDAAPAGLATACAGFDIVTAPFALPPACTPHWLRLDLPAQRAQGAAAITSAQRHLTTVAMRAGDQPWSPAALPGMRPRLLGAPEWTGVIAE